MNTNHYQPALSCDCFYLPHLDNCKGTSRKARARDHFYLVGRGELLLQHDGSWGGLSDDPRMFLDEWKAKEESARHDGARTYTLEGLSG